MSIELKIKSKSLAEEASIIRKEERKLLSSASWDRAHQQEKEAVTKYYKYKTLRDHRKTIVSSEARLTYLARAYIAGRPYSYVESTKPLSVWEPKELTPIVTRVVKMVSTYSSIKVTNEAIIAWIKANLL